MRGAFRIFGITVCLLVASFFGLSTSASADTNNKGTYTEDRLYPNQYLLSSNSAYKLWMQPDGNLVLYKINVRVCWASNTNGTPGTYADYNDHSATPPDLTLKNSSYGDQGHWWGGYEYLHKNGNLSINTRGEVWIAWKKWIHC